MPANKFSLGDTDKVADAIDKWKQAAQQPGGPDPEELGRMVDDLLQQETSFAEQNAKRFRAVNEAFEAPDFPAMVNLVDVMMLPVDKAVNVLLKRSSILKAIRYKDAKTHEMSVSELKECSRQFFLSWTRGELGERVIADFLDQLKSEQLEKHIHSCSDPSIAETCFSLMIFGITDIWWRCSFKAETFPCKMFSLAECDLATFQQRWQEYRSICARCPHCVDAGFSHSLLMSTDLTAMQAAEIQAFYHEFPGFVATRLLGGFIIYGFMI